LADTSDLDTSPTLLRRLRQSPTDQAAWDLFVHRYGPKIFAWSRHQGLQEADAQDVTQSVLLRMATRISSFEVDPSRRFRAWLKTITHHAWVDLVTDRKKPVGSGDSRIGELLDSVQAREDLINRVEEAYDLELMEAAMSRVRLQVQARTWEAFQLTAVKGLSGADAASQLNMTISAVFKARSNVQKRIKEEIRVLEEAGTS
jgi:RNA polymerase sigma-70 factor (ECF subfamily)